MFSLVHNTHESPWVHCSRDAMMPSSADGSDMYPYDLSTLRRVNRKGEQKSWRVHCSFQSDLSSFFTPEALAQYARNGFAAKAEKQFILEHRCIKRNRLSVPKLPSTLITNNSVIILNGMGVQIPEPIATSPQGFWLVRYIRSATNTWLFGQKINKTVSKHKSMRKMDCKESWKSFSFESFPSLPAVIVTFCNLPVPAYSSTTFSESSSFTVSHYSHLENKATTASWAELCWALSLRINHNTRVM